MKNVKMFYPECNDSKNAKAECIYSTKDYSMFTPLKHNRGEDKGIESKRLNDFKRVVAENKFFFTWVNVIINKAGVVIDGHHRLQLLKELGLPINFIVTHEKKFNPKNDPNGVKLLSAIAALNAVNSMWTGTQHFNAAVNSDLQLAVQIKLMKARFDVEFNIDRKQITGGRIFNLLKKNVSGLQSTLVDVSDYEDTSLIERLLSDDFEQELRFIYGIMKTAKNFNQENKNRKRITGFKVVAAAMPLVWDKELNMVKFLKAVEIYEFDNVADSWSGGKYYVNMIRQELLNVNASNENIEIKRKRKELRKALK